MSINTLIKRFIRPVILLILETNLFLETIQYPNKRIKKENSKT